MKNEAREYFKKQWFRVKGSYSFKDAPNPSQKPEQPKKTPKNQTNPPEIKELLIRCHAKSHDSILRGEQHGVRERVGKAVIIGLLWRQELPKSLS